MSYPRRKDLFDAWAKAMVAGATVDKPNYGKTVSHSKNGSTNKTQMRRRKRRRKRRNRAKKEA